MRDIYNNIKAVQALVPDVQAATVNGAAIDTKGSKSLAFVLNTGAIASSGVFALSMQESDNGSTWANVPADYVQGTLPSSLPANSVVKVGYIGFARYSRIVLTKTSGTSIVAGAVAILEPLDKPAT